MTMDKMSSLILSVVLGILLSLGKKSQGQTCSGIIVDQICHVMVKQNHTFSQAEQECVRRGGHLVSIVNPTYQAVMAILCRDQDVSNQVWIGANRAADSQWRWVSDGTAIGPQGCYRDDPSSPDLTEEISVGNLLPEYCIGNCSARGYMFAGTQNGYRCFCGNSFGKYGHTDVCTTRCAGTPPGRAEWCGGQDRNFIYNVQGQYADWVYNQPNKWGGQQACGVLDNTNQQKFGDEQCSVEYPYICDIPLDHCGGTRYYKRDIGRCYYLSTVKMSWYKARLDCVSRYGDLLKIDSEAVHNDVKLVAADSSDDRLWIGLIRGHWMWSNRREIFYTNWLPGEPKSDAQCAALSVADGFRWKSNNCDVRQYYICQLGIPSNQRPVPVVTVRTPSVITRTTNRISTAVRSTPSSNTPSTTPGGQNRNSQSGGQGTGQKTTADPNNGNGNGNGGLTTGSGVNPGSPQSPGGGGGVPTEPSQGASTSNSQFDPMLIGLIILGIIILLLFIAFLILCCLYKKNSRNEKVDPAEEHYNGYDARPFAPIPNSRSLSQTSMNGDVRTNGNMYEPVYISPRNYNPPQEPKIYTTSMSNGRHSWKQTPREKPLIVVEDY